MYKLFQALFILASVLVLNGCTVSVILTSTHGTADDVVDSSPTTQAETSLDADIPAI